jgi:integrase
MSAVRTCTLEGPFTDAAGKRYFRVRIRLADGSRPRFRVPDDKGYSEERARQWGAWLQEQEDARGGLLKKRQAVELAAKPANDTRDGDLWFDAWEQHRVRKGLTSTRDNRTHYREHIGPTLGWTHVRDWTVDDLRGLVAALDSKVDAGEMSWKYAINVWATARRMVRDAVKSKIDALRVRKDNPAADVEGPDRGDDKAKQFLYPSEFLKFVWCSTVPMQWRRAVAQAIYLFPRDGEHRVLDLEDVDLEHETVHIHQAWDRRARTTKPTKTGVSRRFNIEPNLLPLLRTIHAEKGGAGPIADLPSERDMARGLRRWLKKAGITRRELHDTKSRTTKPLTWHDLRATGLTWMAVRGDEPLKIMQRAGHERFETTQIYVRTAEAIRDGFGQVFPPLPPLHWPTSLAHQTEKLNEVGGADGTRTRGLRRDRPAL